MLGGAATLVIKGVLVWTSCRSAEAGLATSSQCDVPPKSNANEHKPKGPRIVGRRKDIALGEHAPPQVLVGRPYSRRVPADVELLSALGEQCLRGVVPPLPPSA
ncbi:hypothetical protein MRX96_039462 [Rhipicephalus microplus]